MIPGLLACLGLFLLMYRMWPRRFRPCMFQPVGWPLVSIIVPMRNHEKNLGRLLDSLATIDYPHYELIVVDDGADDETRMIARTHRVRLIRAQERPTGWKRKQWACHQGFLAARGSYLLFTDTKCVHHTTGLRRTLVEMLSRGVQGLSTLPCHESPKFWERLCGPFYVFLLALTRPYGKARPGQVLAMSQYLLLERRFYEKIGGHARVRLDGIEDRPLAEALLAEGGRWHVYTGPAVVSLRLFETLGDFVRGWRRNFRVGMGASYWGTPLEIILFMAAAIGEGRLNAPYPWLVLGMTALVLTRMQKNLGRFSLWGVILLPFSLGLFSWITILALTDCLFRRPMPWKKQSYTGAAVQPPPIPQLRAPEKP